LTDGRVIATVVDIVRRRMTLPEMPVGLIVRHAQLARRMRKAS